MISYGFVNGVEEPLILTDPSIAFEHAYSVFQHTVETIFAEHALKEKDFLAEEFVTGVMPEEYAIFEKEESKNVFEKIGRAIVELGNKFVEFVRGIVEKLSNMNFDGKSLGEKMSTIANSKSAVKDELLRSIKAGDLDISSAKNIKEVEELYFEYIATFKNGGSKDKREIIKRKLQDINNSAGIKAVAAVGTVAGATLSVAGLMKLKNELKKSSSDAITAKTNMLKAVKSLLDEKYLDGAKKGEFIITDTDRSNLAKFYSDSILAMQKSITKDYGKLNNISTKINEAFEKIKNVVNNAKKKP